MFSISKRFVLPLFIVLTALLAPALAGVEVWRDPGYDIFALRKVFVLPIEASLKAKQESSVVPQSQRKSELDGWAVSSLREALKKNKPIVKASDALIKDLTFLHKAADPGDRETFFRDAAEISYQAAVEVTVTQKMDVKHVPEEIRTYTVYRDVEVRDKHGKVKETIRIPEEKTEVIPAHDVEYLSTRCLVKVYDIADPNGDHKAAADYSIYREYQGGPVMKVVENIIRASVRELFGQTSQLTRP
ncbi:MAG: hypothetical protein K5841_01725 [Fretibacterium sp.]|nr:hypothetical protein [Fretibacterium sp.]